jgi:hypothetical protein
MELDTLSDKIDTVDSVLTYVVGKLKADFNV